MARKQKQYQLTGRREVAYRDKEGKLQRLTHGQVVDEAAYKKLPESLKPFFSELTDAAGDDE